MEVPVNQFEGLDVGGGPRLRIGVVLTQVAVVDAFGTIGQHCPGIGQIGERKVPHV